jgi:hypothetical protein
MKEIKKAQPTLKGKSTVEFSDDTGNSLFREGS